MKRAMAIAVFAPAFACSTIVGAPLSHAPINSCPDLHPCERYGAKGEAIAQCNDWSSTATTTVRRCDLGRPEYPFTMVVYVPSSSHYAAGRTFVIPSAELSPRAGGPPRTTCIPPTCLELPSLVSGVEKYRVTAKASDEVGLPLVDGTSIPLRVSFVPLSAGTLTAAATTPQLDVPVEAVFTSSEFLRTLSLDPFEVAYRETISVGRYLRIAYPEAPFDAFFPPVFTPFLVREPFSEEFILGPSASPEPEVGKTTPLDQALTGDVTRAEGLDGWGIWLAAAATGRRVSTIQKLTGVSMAVRLHTVGQGPLIASEDGLEVVVAPPDGWLAVPRLQSTLILGTGLVNLLIPPLPAPVSVSGVVAHGDDPTLLKSIPSRLFFASKALRLSDGKSQPTLRYSTAISTDDAGRFATVLPPGSYDVIVEPSEPTGFAKVRDTLDTAVTLGKTFRPPPRTVAVGRVLLADGRPLSEADVVALPSMGSSGLKPRPSRARTDENGKFRFEVDQGQYDLSVDPQAGTGFPRVVQVRSFSTGRVDVGDIVVGPPARLAFVMRVPGQVSPIPVASARVRIFAELVGRGPPAVEIGRATTDDEGRCEILLPQQPR